MQQLTPLAIKSKQGSSGIGMFIFCLVLSLAAIFFLVLPKYQQYSLARKKVANAQKLVDDLKDKQSAVSRILEQMKQRQQDLDKVNMAIPTSADIPEVYAYLETMSKSLNLNITSIQAVDDAENVDNKAAASATPVVGAAGTGSKVAAAKPVVADNGLEFILINMQVNGSLADYISFLNKLQNSLRLIDVQSIDISAADSTKMTFSTALKTYYQKENK